MKNQKRKSASLKRFKRGAPAAPKRSRRETLLMLRNMGLGAVVLGGAGYWMVSEVSATRAELDLTRIGQGAPTIVQIHDPQCPSCIALQREARAALESFGDDDVVYLVANIRTPQGRALANRHGVGHVTLLMFDSEGQMRQALTGERDRATLRGAFAAHIARSRRAGG